MQAFPDNPNKQVIDYIAEPVNTSTWGGTAIARTLKAQYFKNGIANFICNNGYDATAIAEYVGGLNEKQ